MIDKLAVQYPISLLCDLLGAPRSSYYYEPLEADEGRVRQAVEEIAAQFPTYGSRRISAQLGRDPYRLVVNRKRVQRLMKEMKIQCRVKKRTIHTTDSRHSFPLRAGEELIAKLIRHVPLPLTFYQSGLILQ